MSKNLLLMSISAQNCALDVLFLEVLNLVLNAIKFLTVLWMLVRKLTSWL